MGLSERSNADRVNPDWFGNVLELRWTEIGDLKFEPSLDLAIRILGHTDCARHADAFQSRGNVDAVAHQIAVAFLDNVA